MGITQHNRVELLEGHVFFFDHARRSSDFPSQLEPKAVAELEREIAEFLGKPSLVRSQTDVPEVWRRALGGNVLYALERLSFKKCPFCERRQKKLQVYRFRPPAHAEPSRSPSDRECYLWLAFDWSNFYPICADCLPANKSHFPVRGPRAPAPVIRTSGPESIAALPEKVEPSEYSYLVFPGELEKPWQLFDIKADGLLVPVRNSRRAKETIEHFKLNRPPLLAERAKALSSVSSQLAQRRTMSGELRNQAHAGSIFLMLRNTIQGISGFRDSDPRISKDRIEATLVSMMASETFQADFQLYIGSPAVLRTSPARKPAANVTQRKPMPRLRRIEIENYKSLESLVIDLPAKQEFDESVVRTTSDGDDFGPSLLVLGENAAGKSSFLEAIAIACSSTESLADLALDIGNLLLDPAALGSPDMPRPSKARIELRFEGELRRIASINPGTPISVEAPIGSPLPLIFAYGATRLFRSGSSRKSKSTVETLFHLNRSVPDPEPWLIQLHDRDPAMLGEVVSALRHVIEIDGVFETIHVDEDQHGVRRCFILINRHLPNGSVVPTRQRLNVVSSGYRAVFSLVCDVLRGLIDATQSTSQLRASESQRMRWVREARRTEAIVLVDEIEAHMHPRWKLNIVSGLRRAFPGVTFILTSHDPLCVRGMERNEVLVLNRYLNDGEGMLERVEVISDVGNPKLMTIEQLLTSNLFQLFSTDDVRTDKGLAEMASRLSKDQLSAAGEGSMEAFVQEIEEGLPYGRSEVTALVQEAVADYLRLRRDASSEAVSAARKDAKASVRQFLTGLIG